MRKFTLILFILSITLTINAQVWDFEDGTTQGWEAKIGGSDFVSNGDGTATFSWIAGTKPKINLATTSVDANTYKVLSIVIHNNSEINDVKFRHWDYSQTKDRFIRFSIDNYKDEYVTYYFDLTNDKWSGDQTSFDIIFTKDNANNTTDGSFIIDKIEFLESIPTTEKHIFQFDTDNDFEGFKVNNTDASSVSNGSIVLTPTQFKYPNIQQNAHHVNADVFITVEITLKNLSTDDDMMYLLIPGVDPLEVPIDVSMTEFKTYKADMRDASVWNGEISGYKIRFGDADLENPVGDPGRFGVSSGTGDIMIDEVVFTTTPLKTLANDDIVKNDISLKIYPNPVTNYLEVRSNIKAERIDIYNFTGQRVLSNEGKNTIDTSSLQSGAYILKVQQNNGVVSSKKFIKR